jgi:cobalt-zinc-cadmium efflux system protein
MAFCWWICNITGETDDTDTQINVNKEHSHTSSVGKHLTLAIILNGVIFVVELAGGILTNSLALVSDSLHNLSDFFALILSAIASRVVQWKSNSEKSFGYVRVEIFVAFVNSMALVLIGVYVIYTGVNRFYHPEVIAGNWMLLIAGVGFVVNSAATLLLKSHAHVDLNMKSAYLHLLTDALESLAVVVVAGMIAWKGWYILDPIVSLAIGVFIIRSAWSIVAETVHILTEGTPSGIDLHQVAEFIQKYPGVESIHHLHIWGLSSRIRALSAHIVVRDQMISECENTRSRLEHELEHRFGINHPTLQFESCACKDQGIVVDIYTPSEGH